MQCKVCKSLDRADVMVLCDNCIGGHYLDCLEPKLLKVPEGDWICDKRLKTKKTVSSLRTDAPPPAILSAEVAVSNDITEDLPTMYYLKTNEFPKDISEIEKARIRSKSSRYFWSMSDYLILRNRASKFEK